MTQSSRELEAWGTLFLMTAGLDRNAQPVGTKQEVPRPWGTLDRVEPTRQVRCPKMCSDSKVALVIAEEIQPSDVMRIVLQIPAIRAGARQRGRRSAHRAELIGM